MGSVEGGVSVPVGFRFQPTEEELVDYYLKRKMEDEDFEDSNVVPEIDVCKYDPWDLPAPLFTEPDSPYHDMEWFFFSPRDYKYANSTRSNRRTPRGYWKPTGKVREIKARRSKAVIGRKRTLTFYRYDRPIAKKTKPIAKKIKPADIKTNWVMHQYDRIESSNPKLVQRDFVLCRVKEKSDKKDTTICDEGELSNNNLQSYEDQAAAPEYYSSSSLQSATSKELGVVLQANGINDDCTKMQSPCGDNYHSVTEKNDISTCDEGDPHRFTVSDFQNEAANDTFRELCAQLGINLDPPQLHVTQQSSTYTKLGDVTYTKLGDVMHVAATSNECLKWHPPREDDCSYVTYRNNTSTYDDSQSLSYTASGTENQVADDMLVEQPYARPVVNLAPYSHLCSSTLQSPLYTNLGSVLHDNVYNDKCSKGKSPICDNISTIYDDEQVSNFASNFENQTTDDMTSEVYIQPEDDLQLLFRLPQVHDYTLPPLVNATVGDALHGNN